MSKETPSKGTVSDQFDQVVGMVGPDVVADIVDSFGLPPEGSDQEKDDMQRLAVENDLEKRASEPNVVMPGLEMPGRNTPKVEENPTVDIRDGFDTQRTEGLEANDPITEAVVAASNGNTSPLEALDPESRSAADMIMIASADTGDRPADFVADLANPLDNGELPATNLNQPNPEA